MNTTSYPCNTITKLEEFQRYLKEVLHEAKNHCCDINENNVNVASITVDIKSLSDYLYKFSANLSKLLGPKENNDSLNNAVFCEVQNFIKYKTKSLTKVIPYKNSTIHHADWWGRTFKQITQNIWMLAEKSSVILPGHHTNKISTPLSPLQALEQLAEICAPCWSLDKNWSHSLLKKMQILNALERLHYWKESSSPRTNTTIEETKKWISVFDNSLIIQMHYQIISNMYTALSSEKNMKIQIHLLDCLRDLKNTIAFLLQTTMPFSVHSRIQRLFILLDTRIQTLEKRHDENGKMKHDIFLDLRRTLLNIIKVFHTSSSKPQSLFLLYSALQNITSECLTLNSPVLFSNRNALWKTGKMFKNTVYSIISGLMYPCYTWYTTHRCFFPTTSSRTAHEINTLLLEIVAEVQRDESGSLDKNKMPI
jgi:hypothetical protein